MKYILSVLLTLVTFTIYAQEITEPVSSNNLFIGLNLSPDVAFRTLKTNDGSVQFIEDLRNKAEGPKFGYTGGLNIKYNLTSKSLIEGGIQYSNKGYQFKRDSLVFADMLDPRYGFVYQIADGVPTHAKILYNFHYLDIPLRFILSLGEKKFKFLGSIGITTNILLWTSNTSVVEYEGGKTERKTYKVDQYDYKKINLSPTISLGANYTVNKKFNISVEPVFRYGLLDIIDAPLTGKLWNAGLNFTFYYKLK